MKNYLFTAVGLFLSTALYLITVIFELELFELFVSFLSKFERFELDEFFIPIIIMIVFLSIDLIRRQKSQAVEIEKVKVYKAMLSSSYHVLNNFLNQMYIIRLTAEKSDDFPKDVLLIYDRIIEDAKIQLQSLGNVADINEASILSSVEPKPGNKKHSPVVL